MSERTIKWWHVVAWMATALMIGLNIGYRQMKRWQDGWYAAHPVVKEVEVPAKFPLLIDGEKRICHYVDETHFICEPPAPAPKPSKGKRKPRTIEQLNAMPGPKMCEMSQPGATLYWPARANGECHREDWGDGSWKPQPEVKPAPKCANGPIIYTIPCGPVPVLICDGGPNCPPVSVVQP
jgi:hypothetical protein